jgi:hypothetical protein
MPPVTESTLSPSFARQLERLKAGESGLLPESAIEPLDELPDADTFPEADGADVLDQAVVIKLNGGLGTSMGMTQAKSLLEVKDGPHVPRHHRPPGARPAPRSARGCRSC